MKRLATTLAVLTTVTTALAADQIPRSERIHFERGRSDGSVQGKIQGYETVHYLVGAGAGQRMTIELETSHGTTYFNLFAPGAQPGRDAALQIGEIAGNRFDGRLEAAGDYLVQVYMMRSAARRTESAEFTLKLRIEGAADPTARAPEAGPWPVDIDASGDLQARSGSSAILAAPRSGSFGPARRAR